MRHILISLAILAGSGCVSRGPSRPTGGVITSATGNGRVYYSDNATQHEYATLAAAVIDKYYVQAGVSVGRMHPGPVEVWLVQDPLERATTYEHCIVFSGVGGRIEFIDWVLAHEFVHWHAQETALRRNLPLAIEEGMCVLVASKIVPRFRKSSYFLYNNLIEAARKSGRALDLISLLNLTAKEWRARPLDDEFRTMYALGFALTATIGIDELCAAAERGPVTPEEILAMAGVSPDGTGLELPPALLDPVGAEIRFSDADGTELGRTRLESHAAGQVPSGSTRIWIGPIH